MNPWSPVSSPLDGKESCVEGGVGGQAVFPAEEAIVDSGPPPSDDGSGDELVLGTRGGHGVSERSGSRVVGRVGQVMMERTQDFAGVGTPAQKLADF